MVYRYELRRQIRGDLAWGAVLAAVLWGLQYGFYPLFLDSQAVVEEYIAAFPEGFAAAFGLDATDLFGVESFFNLVYLYEAVLGACMAGILALTVFDREKRDRCGDFLLTRPVGRGQIFGKKWLACLTLVALCDIPYGALFLYSQWDWAGLRLDEAGVWLRLLCLPLTQVLYLSFGCFAAVFLRRVRSATGLGAGLGLAGFLLSAIQSLTEEEMLQYISPLHYFDPKAVAQTGGYDIATAAVALGLMALCTAAAFLKYTREDLRT